MSINGAAAEYKWPNGHRVSLQVDLAPGRGKRILIDCRPVEGEYRMLGYLVERCSVSVRTTDDDERWKATHHLAVLACGGRPSRLVISSPCYLDRVWVELPDGMKVQDLLLECRRVAAAAHLRRSRRAELPPPPPLKENDESIHRLPTNRPVDGRGRENRRPQGREKTARGQAPCRETAAPSRTLPGGESRWRRLVEQGLRSCI